jgi:hypothetical protein
MDEDRIVHIGIGTVIILLCAFGLSKCTGCMPNYSQGERTGVVVKISNKGVMFRSWEGQMNLGAAAIGGDGMMVPTVFQFSTLDPKIADQLSAAAQHGSRVTLKYRQWLIPPIQIDTSYVIEEVRPASKDVK